MIKKLVCTALMTMTCWAGISFADDTELYVFESSTRTGARPKVLIIFDNSGSMATVETSSVGGYDPNYSDGGVVGYPAVGSGNSFSEEMLYFTKGTGFDNSALPTPDSPSESRRFLAVMNGCNASKASLALYGRFTGYLRQYTTKGQTGTWEELADNSGANARIIDCWEDIGAEDPVNAASVSHGFPADGLTQSGQPVAYNYVSSPGDAWDAAILAAKQTKFGTGEPITLYTDNYLRWNTLVERGELPIVPQSRLDIAKDAITNIVSSTPTIDFGLSVFNLDYPREGDRDGGRIVAGIQNTTAAARSDLLATIGQLPAETNTPLCETLFEAYRYFSGGPVTYGHKDSNYNFGRGDRYVANIPPYDTSIESGTNYISPFQLCSDIAYVIYITDGSPTLDAHANAAIATLTATANAAGDYSTFSEGLSAANSPSYLPALASYLFNNDLITQVDATGVDHRQYVRTFTIGFSEGATDAAPLLKETAKRGGGEYFVARDSLELQSALNDALTSILSIDSSFTSPSVASNNFDRTQTFDAVYYAMFLPSTGPRWRGNLKKLQISSAGMLVDSLGVAAIDDNGNIKDSACSFWTDCSAGTDGGQVDVGGAAAKLQILSQRNILSNLSSGLEVLTIANAANKAGGTAELASYLSTTESELTNTVNWLLGLDVDDDNNNGSTADKRSDIMGDPLHSKPLAINFGTESATDIRVLVGTNQGLLHMFKDLGNRVEEPWAFIPYELLPNLTTLRKNIPSGGHSIYGLDGSPVAYTTTDANGIVNKAWVFMGMRRGGSAYYGLDISSPDNPRLMWTINANSAGFADLGQSWSDPVVTEIPGHTGPVLIFGGGYDISYDATPNASPLGRAIYIVDAESGSLLHSFGASMTSDTVILDLEDSIPNAVTILDSDYDGLTDRLYVTDTGGNVWRLDLPSEITSTWTAFKFASLGGITAADRRFFAEVSVAQTVFTNIVEATTTDASGATVMAQAYQNVPYDAVVVGSGNRPHPLDVGVEDMFFVLQDRNVISKSFDNTSNTIPAAITLTNLYDVTTNAPISESDNIAFGRKLGWYYDFTDVGEKSLASALIFDGKVYFTSYVPPVIAEGSNICAASGEGRLYLFDLHKGFRTNNQLYYELGERIPDTPQIVIPKVSAGETPYIYVIGVGQGEINDGKKTGTIKVSTGLDVNKIYYHLNE